jgi:hypothetical protein
MAFPIFNPANVAEPLELRSSHRRRRSSIGGGDALQTGFCFLSATSVLALLIGYHRFYDAALLAIPLAWVISSGWRDAQTRRLSIAIAACCAVFFVPGAVMLDRFSQSQSFLWDSILLRHQIWALIVMLVVLFLAVQRGASHTATIATSDQHIEPYGTTR